MLPSKVLQFPFKSGLAEGIDPKQAPPGTLTRAVNVVWNKSGRLEKRSGNKLLGNTGGTPRRIFARGMDELCIIDGTSVLAYTPDGPSTFKTIDKVPEVGLTWTTLADTFRGVIASDMALSASGLLVHAFVTGDPTLVNTTGSLFVQVIDRATGTRLMPPTIIHDTDVQGVRVHIIGTLAFVLFKYTTFYAVSIVNLATISLALEVAILSDGVSHGGWDSRIIGSNFVICYETTAFAVPPLRLRSFNTALVLVTTGSVSGEAGTGFDNIGIDGILGERIYVAYSIAGDFHVRYATVDATTLAQVLAPTVVDAVGGTQRISICRLDATHAVLVHTREVDVPTATVSHVVSSGGAVTVPRGTWYTALCCRPFLLNGRCYITVSETAPNTAISKFTGANVYLMEIETTSVPSESVNIPHRYVGKIDLLIGAFPVQFQPPPSPVTVSGTQVLLPSFYLAIAPSTFNTWRTGLRLVSATAGASLPNDMWRTVSYDKDSFILGGVLHAYDGRIVFDYGFARPPIVLAAVITTPFGAIVAGDYLYAIVNEYRSATGLLHRSEPTVLPSILTIAATPSLVTFAVFGSSVGNRQRLSTGFVNRTVSTVLIAIYRSTIGGAVPQRLTYEPTYNIVANDPQLSTQSLVDQRADASIDGAGTALASRPALYTTGGILSDLQPVGGVTMFLHRSRIWQLAGDLKTWWYSKSFQDDLGTAPGFSPSLLLTFDEPQVGGASMDEKIVFFSSTSIAYLQGEGPGPNGQNSDYGTPVRIQTDTGCISARSIVSMRDGIMFQGGDSDIHLLDRGLSVEWVGREVKDQLTAFPIITSAIQVPAKNEVRFTCTTSDGGAGITLVYNYHEKQWTTFSYDKVGGVVHPPIVDACMYQGKYTILTSTGNVYQEDDTTNLDDGNWFALDVESAEIFAEGPLSYQRMRRVYLLGELLSACDVTISLASAGKSTYDQARLWTSNELAALGNNKIGIHVKKQACDSIRFRVTDAPPSSPGTPIGLGKGVNLSAIGFEVAPQPDLARRSAGARK